MISIVQLLIRHAAFLRRLAVLLLALAAALAVPVAAQAASMLFLTTTETDPTARTNITNAWTAFSAQATKDGLTPVNGRGTLSDATTPLDLTDAKLVVVVTDYNPIATARMAELTAALETRPDLAILIFSEGCCSVDANLQQFINAVQAIEPAGWNVGLAAEYGGNYSAPLNTASLYASTFSGAGLTTLVAGAYTPITGVPSDYALYTQRALPAPPPNVVTQSVVGLFIPQTASNGGQGACLFLTADASEFSNSHPGQPAQIAQAFSTAALDPNGACAKPVAGVPDLSPTLSGLTNLTIGTAAGMTLTVSNANQAASPASQVTVTLPTGIQLSGSPPAGCTAAATGFSCPVPALAAGASAPDFNFQIIANQDIRNAAILAEVTAVAGEVDTGNNTTQLLISAPGTPDLASAINGPATLNVNMPSTYTAVVTSQGNLPSNDGVISITLPANTQLDPSVPLPSNCQPTNGGAGLTCTLAAIAQGTNVTIPFTVIAAQPFSTATISASVTGVTGETNTGNNGAQLSVAALTAPDLTSAISGPRYLDIGLPASYTAVITNLGSVQNTDGTVSVALPAGMQLILPTSLPDGCQVAADGTGFTCALTAIAQGSSLQLPFDATATQPFSNATLSANITGVTGEIITANDAAQRLISATSAPDLSSAILGDSSAVINTPAHYLVIVTNQGNTQNTDGTVSITLPAGMQLNPSDTLPDGCQAAASGTGFTCTLTAIAQSADVTFAFSAIATQVFSDGDIRVQLANVTGDQYPENDSADLLVSAGAASPSGGGGTTSSGGTPQPIPTMGEWALALMALLLGAGAAVGLRRGGGART